MEKQETSSLTVLIDTTSRIRAGIGAVELLISKLFQNIFLRFKC